jgi:hypothetical protein
VKTASWHQVKWVILFLNKYLVIDINANIIHFIFDTIIGKIFFELKNTIILILILVPLLAHPQGGSTSFVQIWNLFSSLLSLVQFRWTIWQEDIKMWKSELWQMPCDTIITSLAFGYLIQYKYTLCPLLF